MKAYLLVLSVLLSVAGCSSQQPRGPDFFAAQDQFAAMRAVQTTRFDGIEYDEMMGHVVESLLDLDCTLQETNKRFGVISARGAGRWYPGNMTMMTLMRRTRAGCAGHNVTVTVTEAAAGQLQVRATFFPPNPEADRVFQLLIERSVAQAAAGEAS
jgi:hypothetical protein